MCSTDIFLGLLALLFPPLPVWVKRGICSADSIINILLCMLGYLPGLIHAWYIIAQYPEPEYDYQAVGQDSEGGHVYVIVHEQDGRQHRCHAQQQQQRQAAARPAKPQGNMTYGTTSTNTNIASSAAQHAEAGAGSSSSDPNAAPPPSYAQVVAGDHKIQSQD